MIVENKRGVFRIHHHKTPGAITFNISQTDPGLTNMNGIVVTCSVLVIGLLCCAGCTSTEAPETPVPAVPQATIIQTSTVTTADSVPAATPPAAPIIPATADATPAISTPVGTPVPVTPTWIQESYGKDAMSDPRIVLLTFDKECMAFDIPDCGMRVAFPQAAGDPGYGIRQPVPKLLMLTEEEIDAFTDTYSIVDKRYPDSERRIDPNAIGGASCAGVPANPVWNFVRVNATLMPRNARPAEYDIGINVRSRRDVIAQVTMNRTFILDQPVIIVRYIPLKVEEMDAFDSIGLVFARRG
jgi:hypothetical protein